MQRGIVTKISVYEDLPTSVSSTLYGANLDCFAFNVGLISKHRPDLVQKLIDLYEECKKIRSK